MKTARISFLGLIQIVFLLTINVSSQTIQINTDLTRDTIIYPFNGIDKIFSLKINGTIRLLSDTSLVRIIVIDQTGNQFFAYEAYPLISLGDTFSIRAGCDETCYSDGLYPSSLKIDIINCNHHCPIKT